MADEADWIDEAAMRSMYQDGNQPSRDQEIQLYKQLTGEGIPIPRPRPPEADDPNAEWNSLSEKQKQLRRKEEIRQYNEIMREYDVVQKRKSNR